MEVYIVCGPEQTWISFCDCRQFTKELNLSFIGLKNSRQFHSFVHLVAHVHVYCDCIVTTRYLSWQGLRDAHPIKPIIIIIN